MAKRTKVYSDIGKRIEELRKKALLTQKELGKKVNKSESAVRMWELGYSEPDINTLNILAEIFSVSTDYITGKSPSPDVIVIPSKMSIGKRIKEERLALKMTQEELANLLNVSKSTIGMYETGQREPNLEIIKILSYIFEVSTDYLLGKNDNVDCEESDILMTNICKKIKSLRKQYGITQESLASSISVERSSVGKYETGTVPSLDVLIRISKYFDVSLDYLIGRTNDKNIFSKMNMLTPEDYLQVVEFIEFKLQKSSKLSNS